jgi:heme exporter protein A
VQPAAAPSQSPSSPGFDRVEAKGVTRIYGRQRAVGGAQRGVDFTLRAGEAVALLGPNGAGKSTLVSMLATLVTPSSGTVTYGGEPADDEVRRRIGVIAHESLCYGDLSALENVTFFARLYGVEDASSAARKMVERVGLTDEAAQRPARTYSRGMLQRLAVARALVHRPALLLADEPFTGLDRAGVALLAELLAEERARGAMLLVVTHDFDAVAQLVDRVVVLHKGRIALDEALPPGRGLPKVDDIAERYRRALAGTGSV